MDALLFTDQQPGHYYLAARAYSSALAVGFDNITTTAIVEYKNGNGNGKTPPLFPYVPSLL